MSPPSLNLPLMSHPNPPHKVVREPVSYQSYTTNSHGYLFYIW